jgi:hypothetical protein
MYKILYYRFMCSVGTYVYHSMGVDTICNVGGGLMTIAREVRENFLCYY